MFACSTQETELLFKKKHPFVGLKGLFIEDVSNKMLLIGEDIKDIFILFGFSLYQI